MTFATFAGPRAGDGLFIWLAPATSCERSGMLGVTGLAGVAHRDSDAIEEGCNRLILSVHAVLVPEGSRR